METGCRNVVILTGYCLFAWLLVGASTGGGHYGFFYAAILGLAALPGLVLARRKALAYSLVLMLVWLAGAVTSVAKALSDSCNDESCIGLLILGPIVFGAGALLHLGVFALRKAEPGPPA